MSVTKSANLTILDGKAAGPWDILITTGAADRDRDTINPMGWVTDSYMRNPVVMWAHDYVGMTPTGGVPIGKTVSLQNDREGLIASFVFRDPANDGDFVNVIRSAWEQGILNAASVGFDSIKWRENDRGGKDFSEQELLEWSIVAIPANATALRRSYEVALKAAGMGALLDEPRKFAGATVLEEPADPEPPAAPVAEPEPEPTPEPEAAPEPVEDEGIDEQLLSVLSEFVSTITEILQ